VLIDQISGNESGNCLAEIANTGAIKRIKQNIGAHSKLPGQNDSTPQYEAALPVNVLPRAAAQ
jgi:hypothetical protein